MKFTANSLIVALAIGIAGCDARVSTVSNDAPQNAPPSRLQGTNAGSNTELTTQVSGWTYHLMAGQDRIAAYQFNEWGTVVATVGKEGQLDYPALFWRIDENDQIVIADDRQFREVLELWTILSVDDSVVTIQNATNDRQETYWRKQHWPPSARDNSTVGDQSENAEPSHALEPAARMDSNGK